MILVSRESSLLFLTFGLAVVGLSEPDDRNDCIGSPAPEFFGRSGFTEQVELSHFASESRFRTLPV